MKKFFDFVQEHGTTIIIVLLLLVFAKGCSTSKRIKKMEKTNTERIDSLYAKIDSMAFFQITKTDLEVEGLKSEKRMIQSCDRKLFDLNRENQIDAELKELQK